MCCDKMLLLLLFLFIQNFIFSQIPRKSFELSHFNEDYYDSLKKEFGDKKHYPAELEKAILVALSYYPELKNTSIRFEHRANHSPGFTRVTWGGLFESPHKRHFLVVISNGTEDALMPLIFDNISFDAQIGLLGHELAHVSNFLQMSTLQIIQHGIKSLASGYLDLFEGNTDAICIDHGLGYQLLAWSVNVRQKMNTINWDGPDRVHRTKKRNRYMNPEAILQRISTLPLYRSSR